MNSLRGIYCTCPSGERGLPGVSKGGGGWSQGGRGGEGSGWEGRGGEGLSITNKANWKNQPHVAANPISPQRTTGRLVVGAASVESG